MRNHFVTTISTNVYDRFPKKHFENVSGNDYLDTAVLDSIASDGVYNAILVPMVNVKNNGAANRLTVMMTVEGDYTDGFSDELDITKEVRDQAKAEGKIMPEFGSNKVRFIDRGDPSGYICTKNVQMHYNNLIGDIESCLGKDYLDNLSVDFVTVPHDELAETHYTLFKNLIRATEPISSEEKTFLFIECTFGMKSYPMLALMALQYQYRFNPHVLPEALFYQQFIQTNKVQRLYDYMDLFHINNSLEHMSVLGADDPIGAIEDIFG